MAVDYLEVMGALGSIASKHPQTTSLLMQTYSLWAEHADEAVKVYNEYKNTAASATGKLDVAGIAMQLAAMHPNVAKLLLQTVTMWQARIPDLIQVINEFQESSVSAMKS